MKDSQANETRIQVLLVDDEEDFVETLAIRLRMRRLDVTTAGSGDEAIARIETAEPDVIVLDLKMRGMDGIEVLRRVRNSHPSVEVIILTGHGSEQYHAIARRLGAFEHVNKPVDIDSLISRITMAFDHRQRRLDDSSRE